MSSRHAAPAIVLSLALLLSLAACGGGGAPDQPKAQHQHTYVTVCKHAYSECNADEYWHVVADTYSVCSTCGDLQVKRTGDKKTAQKCKGQGAVQLCPTGQHTLVMGEAFPPPVDHTCQGQKIRSHAVVLACESGIWIYKVYDIIECVVEGKLTLRRSVNPIQLVPTATVCEQAAPKPHQVTDLWVWLLANPVA